MKTLKFGKEYCKNTFAQKFIFTHIKLKGARKIKSFDEYSVLAFQYDLILKIFAYQYTQVCRWVQVPVWDWGQSQHLGPRLRAQLQRAAKLCYPQSTLLHKIVGHKKANTQEKPTVALSAMQF